MIIQLKTGGQLIVSECPWFREGGVYLAAGNMRGSQGIIMKPAELDQAIAELTRIRDAIAERATAKQQKRSRAA